MSERSRRDAARHRRVLHHAAAAALDWAFDRAARHARSRPPLPWTPVLLRCNKCYNSPIGRTSSRPKLRSLQTQTLRKGQDETHCNCCRCRRARTSGLRRKGSSQATSGTRSGSRTRSSSCSSRRSGACTGCRARGGPQSGRTGQGGSAQGRSRQGCCQEITFRNSTVKAGLAPAFFWPETASPGNCARDPENATLPGSGDHAPAEAFALRGHADPFVRAAQHPRQRSTRQFGRIVLLGQVRGHHVLQP